MHDEGSRTDTAPELGVLSAEADALSEVLHALESEHEALLTNDPGMLESAVADKNDALQRYLDAKSAREAQGLGNNLTESLGSHPRLSEGQRASGIELASALRVAGESCKDLNQRNGRLISALQEHTQRAINVVRGGEAGVTLYGQHGTTNLERDSRVIGRA